MCKIASGLVSYMLHTASTDHTSSNRYLRPAPRLLCQNQEPTGRDLLNSHGFPCCLSLPAALTCASVPYSFKSSYDMISPQMNLFSKSELTGQRDTKCSMKQRAY